MLIHPDYTSLAQPENLADLCIEVSPQNSLELKDRFTKAAYFAAIYDSPELKAISQNFDYQLHGYRLLPEVAGRPERRVVAEVRRGRLDRLFQAVNEVGSRNILLDPLSYDMRRYEDTWSGMFNAFANVMTPLMGSEYEIRMKCLHYELEYFHRDKEVIALLPLGTGRPSTVLKFPDGHIMRPSDGELVIVAPEQEHASPIYLDPRICLAATKHTRHFV